jgi:hypothetical protein
MKYPGELKLVLCFILFLFGIILFLSLNSTASTIIVPDHYQTIQGAVNNANDGDRIFVRNGVYYENVVINTTTFVPEPASLILEGESQQTEIVGGDNFCLKIYGETGDFDVTVKNLKLRDADIGIWTYLSMGLIQNVNISNIQGVGITIYYKNWTIQDTSLFNAESGIRIHLHEVDNPIIIENTTISNAGSWENPMLWEESQVRVYNSRFYNVTISMWYLGDYYLENTSFEDSSVLVGIYLYGLGGYPSTANFLNCYVDSMSSIGVGDEDVVFIDKYVDVYISNSIDAPISDVEIKIVNNKSIIYATPYFGGANEVTDLEGKISPVLVTSKYFNDSGGEITYNTEIEVFMNNENFYNNPRIDHTFNPRTIKFVAENKPPIAIINSPSDDEHFLDWGNISFSCFVTDYEDGELKGENLTWTSDLDGILGNGILVELDNLSVGDHMITLSAIDSSDDSCIVSVNITVLKDTDLDDIPDILDDDDDNDNLTDIKESEIGSDPLVSDTDGDGYDDGEDVFPLDDGEWFDFDNDGEGDNSDNDDDGDGFTDYNDEFPLDPLEWKDSDNDGIGDNADLDDDNDGVLDVDEKYYMGSIHIGFLALILIIPIIIILFFFVKRKKGQDQSDLNIPTQYQNPQAQLTNCPSCGYSFEITESARPLNVICPQCGTKGTFYD